MRQVFIKAVIVLLVISSFVGVYYAVSYFRQAKKTAEQAIANDVCDEGMIDLYGECQPIPQDAYFVTGDDFDKCKDDYYVLYYPLQNESAHICLRIPEHGFKVEDYDWECEYPYVRGFVKSNQMGCSIPPENSYVTRDCGWNDNFLPSDCGSKYWSCHAGYKEVFENGIVHCYPL